MVYAAAPPSVQGTRYPRSVNPPPPYWSEWNPLILVEIHRQEAPRRPIHSHGTCLGRVRQTRDLDRLEIENDNFGATEETETRGQPALHADAARDQEVPCRRQREESTGAPVARDP